MAGMTKERKEYLIKYRKENLKRVPLDIDFEFYDEIQKEAKAEGRSVNGYIKYVLRQSIDGNMPVKTENVYVQSDSDKKLKTIRSAVIAIMDALESEP